MTSTPTQLHQLAQLREPFAAIDINLLPKPHGLSEPADCSICGGFHSLPADHVRYVGHAALTKRLLDVDPLWHWQPLSHHNDGTPRFDGNGGLWIELTVCGMTRLGYGHADGKSGGNAIKETIGDALRNAAMRFGAALDLWQQPELVTPVPALITASTALTEQTHPTNVSGKPQYPQEIFKHNLSNWQKLIAVGKSATDLRRKLETNYTLTISQLAALAALDGVTIHADA